MDESSGPALATSLNFPEEKLGGAEKVLLFGRAQFLCARVEPGNLGGLVRGLL